MIEINAKLFRGSVYFNNEQLKCRISYRNVGDEVERLAWSGVQIYCHSALDETKVASTSKGNEISEDEVALSSKETSFHPCKGEKGRLVFSTKPKILFCDLTLHPNEIQTYLYEETIPPDCPPSYYGSWVKYMYKLSIGTQRVNSVIQLLRMPLRVISLVVDINNMPNGHHNNHHTATTTPVTSSPSPSPPTTTATATTTTSPTTSSTNTTKTNENENVHQEDSIPLSSSASNNYVDYDCKESTLDIVLHKLDCLTGKRSPSSFLITNQTGRIARFCLLKSIFKLGEDIVGFFDFTDSTVPCVQFSVTLQSEETLKEAFRLRSGKSTHISSHSRFHEFCLHMNNAQMILPIPLTVTPAFETNLMTLTWKLHVEFVSTKPTEIDTNKMIDNYGVMEQGPAEMKVQTMTWDLPIHVLPTHPLQIGRGLSMPATMSTNF